MTKSKVQFGCREVRASGVAVREPKDAHPEFLNATPGNLHSTVPVLFCCLIIALPAYGDRIPEMIEAAIQEYDAALATIESNDRLERFRRSQRLFRQAIEEGQIQNGAIYVNLGNAALQCEQLGDAILAYRRTLALEPGHAQARQNLEYARTLLPPWVPRPQTQSLLDTFFFWHQMLSRQSRALLAALCFGVGTILIAISIRWQKSWPRHVAFLPLMGWVVFMVFWAWEERTRGTDVVVITVPEVSARAADSAGAPARFAQPLPAGTEATVFDRRDSWLRIRLVDGRDGWVQQSAVTWVIPSG